MTASDVTDEQYKRCQRQMAASQGQVLGTAAKQRKDAAALLPATVHWHEGGGS